jgi:hypothetical protein
MVFPSDNAYNNVVTQLKVPLVDALTLLSGDALEIAIYDVGTGI